MCEPFVLSYIENKVPAYTTKGIVAGKLLYKNKF